MVLYSFAVDAYENGTFAAYSEDGGDYYWRFTYNPPQGEDYQIYYGPINQNSELSGLAEIISSYFE